MKTLDKNAPTEFISDGLIIRDSRKNARDIVYFHRSGGGVDILIGDISLAVQSNSSIEINVKDVTCKKR